jgi:cysteine synthase
MTRRLFREEGLIVGPSTGAIVHAITALHGAGPGVTVGISPDGGQKYASFYAELVAEEGAAS